MKNIVEAEIADQVIGGTPEETAVQPFPNMQQIAPQGALRNLSELRAEFPNLEVLPQMHPISKKFAANQIQNFDVPDFSQFFMVNCDSAVILAVDGGAVSPAAAETIDGVMVIPAGSNLKFYCGGKRQISIGDYKGAAPVVSVLFYVTDKFTVI